MIRQARKSFEIARDVRASLGKEPVDLVLKNCRLINVYSNEIHAADLAIYCGWIVAIRENFTGPATDKIDVGGAFAAPAPVGRPEDAIELRDHERITSFSEAKRSLRNGKTAFIDPNLGSAELGSILGALRDEQIDTSALCFIAPGLEGVTSIQVALKSGFSAPEAFQLGSLNPATHFCVDDVMGSLVPGRWADILLLEDLTDPHPAMTFLKGKKITGE